MTHKNRPTTPKYFGQFFAPKLVRGLKEGLKLPWKPLWATLLKMTPKPLKIPIRISIHFFDFLGTFWILLTIVHKILLENISKKYFCDLRPTKSCQKLQNILVSFLAQNCSGA